MHEAYQCLLKVIRAKNRFKMKALEKLRNRSHLAEEDSEQKTDQIENKDEEGEQEKKCDWKKFCIFYP